jgi:hypothetical protein
VALIAFRTRLSGIVKIAIAVAGLIAIAGMLYFDAKFWGVVLMGVSVMILLPMPWLDLSPVKSIRYRPTWHKYLYAVFGHCVCDSRLFRHIAANRGSHAGSANLYLHLFWFLPVDAVVECNGYVQARAEPCHVPPALSRKRNKNEFAKKIGCGSGTGAGICAGCRS